MAGKIVRFPLERRIKLSPRPVDTAEAFFREHAHIQKYKEKWRSRERSLLARWQAELRRRERNGLAAQE